MCRPARSWNSRCGTRARLGRAAALVVTTPEAKALDWIEQGPVHVTLQPDEVKEIKVTVPASAFKG